MKRVAIGIFAVHAALLVLTGGLSIGVASGQQGPARRQHAERIGQHRQRQNGARPAAPKEQ